jgi:hypothetical protein
MHSAGIPAPMVWLDVEFRHVEAWQHHAADDAVLDGVVRGMKLAHQPIGVYTTSLMWDDIAGNLRLDVPNWIPAGTGRPSDAIAKCSESATGGPTWLVQYTRWLDEDLTCPIMDPVPGRHTSLWRYRHDTRKLFDSGRVVKVLQKQLGVSPTGRYDLFTTLAARKFERTANLPVTGEVQPPEWRKWGAFRIIGGHPFLLDKVVSR